MKTCFVVCPIGSDNSDTRKRSDKLLKYILEPVCTECGFSMPIRVDNLNLSNSITDDIFNHLKESDLVIADLTEHNPNAFYEIGYRTALNKPIIHLKAKNDSIPFDVSTTRTFDYDLTDLDSVSELKERLIQTISAIDFTDNISSSNKEDTSVNFNSQILQQLFAIQDSIKILDSKVSTSSVDTSAISVLADKLAATSSNASPDMAMAQVFTNLLSEPQKLGALLELVEKYPNLK